MKKIFLGWQEQRFQNYIDAFTALGASVEREDSAGCDALLLPGGADIHPRFYNQDIRGAEEINEARDEYELALFYAFFDAKKPILGICRGLQVINVALGGTLHQHIAGHSRLADADRLHGVQTDDALLRSGYGARFTVNSAHHQAADRLGAGLHVAARAEDGIIEALRHDTRPVFAVQWHPERLGGEGERLLKIFLEKIS